MDPTIHAYAPKTRQRKPTKRAPLVEFPPLDTQEYLREEAEYFAGSGCVLIYFYDADMTLTGFEVLQPAKGVVCSIHAG